MPTKTLLAAAAALLLSPAALAIPEGPEPNTPEWFQREAQNYARTLEAATEQVQNPDFQILWNTQSTANRQSWIDRALADPSWVGYPSGNSPNTPAGAMWSSVSVSDPTRYPEAEGPNGRSFYETEADVLTMVFYDSGCARITARLWAPRSWKAGDALLPGVVIQNGSIQASQTMYWWAAQALVRAGYVAMTFDPRGQGRSDLQTPSAEQGGNVNSDVFYDGMADAIDFFRSGLMTPYGHNSDCAGRYPTEVAPHNPFFERIDLDRLGIAGHSLGAAGISSVQGYPADRFQFPDAAGNNPVDVLVAWDALGANEEFPPRVPAMGQTSEYGIGGAPFASAPDPEEHKGAYAAYVAAGVPAYQFTIQGSTHFEWSLIPGFPTTSWCADMSSGSCEGGWGMPMARHYTLAWMDRWLKLPGEAGYDDAEARLLDDTRWCGRYSFYHRSARNFPLRDGSRITSDDVRADCLATDTAAATATPDKSTRYGGALQPLLLLLVALLRRRLLALAAALALSACGHSTVPGNQTRIDAPANCGPAAVDYSAQSLPDELVPRPGPAALYLPPPRAPQLENTGAWQAPPILISGASAYRCGEFIYQDWLFDDHGAAGVPDPNDPQGATAYLFSPKAGSLTYPTNPAYANNAADLLELRIKPLADATLFRVSLNTLQDPALVAFTIALGGGETRDWPYAAGVSSPAEWFLSVRGGAVELLKAADGSVVAPAPLLSIDLERRQFEISVPRAAVDPGSGTLRVAAGVGLWDAAAGTYLQAAETASATAPGGQPAGGAALFNLAFRNAEPTPDFAVFSGRTIADAALLSRVQGHWWRERLQADALLAGDVSAFFAEVDFGKLASGENDESAVPQTGFMNRLFASRYIFGQGVDYLKECGGISAARPCDGAMVGQLQPYSIYVPEKTPAASGYGLTLLLHALSANLNQYLGSRHAVQLGERGTGTLVVTPAGRGPDGFYFDVAEADMFEVWADVARHFPLDPDWTVMTGISMGGIGSFRLGTRYPDLFARLMPVVAAAGDAEERLASLRNVPTTMWCSLFDELQPVVSTEGTVTALTDLNYRLEALRFNTWDHLTPSTYDYYLPGVDFLGESRVERDPVRISYVLAPAEDEPRVDAIADRAYWISDLKLRDNGLATGLIDVRSEGFGLAEPAPLAVVQTNEILQGGNHEPAPYTRRVLEWSAPQTVPAQNKLTIRAQNIASLTIEPSRARVDCDAELSIESDGPVEVTLAGCD